MANLKQSMFARAHSSERFSHDPGQMAGCSGLETEMDLGEVKIRRGGTWYWRQA